MFGNPLRIINGYDSFGNTCGVKNNERYNDFPLSGENTFDKPYVFFFDMKELRQSIKVCVKNCPDKLIDSKDSYRDYVQTTGNSLCTYDFNKTDLNSSQNNLFHYLGPCPTLPVVAQ